ncbi:interleukin-20 receptor subunit beta isoform X2 [Ascaphus truei]|uniref:interleukin-20 receptor subunit beta isoform X2 n=1 Tax=Ascaphus truei TaxID=8439 RepID=UPI003F5ABE66
MGVPPGLGQPGELSLLYPPGGRGTPVEHHRDGQQAGGLPAPENISLVSTNLKHFLYWSPVSAARGNVTYSIQVQGEFERKYKNQSWSEAEECPSISSNRCNVTEDISSNVFYNLRVRAEQGNQTSHWANLYPPFNRTTTILTPPVISLQVRGLHITVDIEDFGPSFLFFLFCWRKGQDDVVHSMKMTRSATATYLGAVEGGSEYCAQAIAYAKPIFRNSSVSSPVCVTVGAGRLSPLATGFVAFIGVIAGLVLLPLLAWNGFRLLQYSCCPDVDIPDILKETYSSRKTISRNYSGVENCEEILSVEPRGCT